MDALIAPDGRPSRVYTSAGRPSAARYKRMAAAAVELLGNIEGSSVDARLYEYLNNENRQVQVAAARQLEAHGDNNPKAQIVNEIGVSLTDDYSGVRSRAAQELGRTKSARAVGLVADRGIPSTNVHTEE